jgi:hypothetical protein
MRDMLGETLGRQQILLNNIGPLLSDIKWKRPALCHLVDFYGFLKISQEFSNPVSRVFNVDQHLWLLIALYDVDDTIWLFNMAMENPHF